jgi:hypothetical protein
MQEAFSPENCVLQPAWQGGDLGSAQVHLHLPSADGHLFPPSPSKTAGGMKVALLPFVPLAEPPAEYQHFIFPHGAILQAAVERWPRRLEGRSTVVRLPALAPDTEPETQPNAQPDAQPDAQPILILGLDRDFSEAASPVVTQAALLKNPHRLIFQIPREERALRRVHELCSDLSVSAEVWQGGAPIGAFSQAHILAGTPRWAEFFLAATCGLLVAWVGRQDPRQEALLLVLDQADELLRIQSRLQLAAALDPPLADPGALKADGLAFRYELTGAAAPLIEVLRSLGQRDRLPSPHFIAVGTGADPFASDGGGPGGKGAVAKEPRAQEAPGAKTPTGETEKSPAEMSERIDAELEKLKARLKAETKPVEPPVGGGG